MRVLLEFLIKNYIHLFSLIKHIKVKFLIKIYHFIALYCVASFVFIFYINIDIFFFKKYSKNDINHLLDDKIQYNYHDIGEFNYFIESMFLNLIENDQNVRLSVVIFNECPMTLLRLTDNILGANPVEVVKKMSSDIQKHDFIREDLLSKRFAVLQKTMEKKNTNIKYINIYTKDNCKNMSIIEKNQNKLNLCLARDPNFSRARFALHYIVFYKNHYYVFTEKNGHQLHVANSSAEPTYRLFEKYSEKKWEKTPYYKMINKYCDKVF